jgi:hypothetical protein
MVKSSTRRLRFARRVAPSHAAAPAFSYSPTILAGLRRLSTEREGFECRDLSQTIVPYVFTQRESLIDNPFSRVKMGLLDLPQDHSYLGCSRNESAE